MLTFLLCFFTHKWEQPVRLSPLQRLSTHHHDLFTISDSNKHWEQTTCLSWSNRCYIQNIKILRDSLKCGLPPRKRKSSKTTIKLLNWNLPKIFLLFVNICWSKLLGESLQWIEAIIWFHHLCSSVDRYGIQLSKNHLRYRTTLC